MSRLVMFDRVGHEVPASALEIKRRLQEIDPRLGLTILPDADAPGGAWWAVTLRWADTDPRRRELLEGTRPLDEAFDVLEFLPRDCSSEQAYGYVVNRLRRINDRSDVTQMLERVHHYNRGVAKKALAPTLELADELLSTNEATLSGARKPIYMNDARQRGTNRDAKRLEEYLRDNNGTD